MTNRDLVNILDNPQDPRVIKDLLSSVERTREFLKELKGAASQAFQVPHSLKLTAHPVVVGKKDDQALIFNPDATDHVIFFLYDGCLISQPTPNTLVALDKLADLSGACIYLPLYPRLPESTAADTYALVQDHFLKLQGRLDPDQELVLGGTGIGATLAAGLCQSLLADDGPQPDKLLLSSPLVNAHLDHPAIPAFDEKDNLLSAAGLREIIQSWAGAWSIEDPRISPILGAQEELPPIWIVAGSNEILLPDTLDYAQRLNQLNNVVKVTIGFGCDHNFLFAPVPAGESALQDIAGDWV